MGAQRGRDLVLRIERTPPFSGFETVAGLRTRSLTLNARPVEVTDADSVGAWRELLDGAGTRSLALSGSGVFRDAAADALMRTLFFAQAVRRWAVVVPDFGQFTGPMLMTRLDYGGDFDGEVTFSLAVQSAGEVTFNAL